MRPRLIAGNWKMHKTAAEAVEFVQQFRTLAPTSRDIDVLLIPPFISLHAIQTCRTADDQFFLGAQNLHWETEGAFTGEISGRMLKAVGCSFVLVGHSERRHLFHETNEEVNKKVKAALCHELMPIVCVGETLEEREGGRTHSVVQDQLVKGLAGVDRNMISQVTLAYEPVWAIGTGRAATVDQAAEVHRVLRSILLSEWGSEGGHLRILYGGSVSPQNAEALFACSEIDGALIGKACLDPSSFASICRVAAEATNDQGHQT